MARGASSPRLSGSGLGGDALSAGNYGLGGSMKISWIGLLNFLVLQWFFIRFAKVLEDGEMIGFLILRWIVPLTGWWSDYIFIGKNLLAFSMHVNMGKQGKH